MTMLCLVLCCILPEQRISVKMTIHCPPTDTLWAISHITMQHFKAKEASFQPLELECLKVKDDVFRCCQKAPLAHKYTQYINTLNPFADLNDI